MIIDIILMLLIVAVASLWFRQMYIKNDVEILRKAIVDISTMIKNNVDVDAKVLQNEERINNIVDMMRRNARIAALKNETGTMNSPLKLTEKSLPYYQAVRDELVNYYKTVGITLTDRELFEDIQRRFSHLFEEQICAPLHMVNNECLELAIAYMKQEAAGDAA